jgi:hypothetical protein
MLLLFKINTMSNRLPLTVTIIALNEEASLPHAIESVRWAEEILVVDSGSTDRTTSLAKELGARVLFQSWLGYGQQKNYAQSQATYPWILNLDADEVVPPELAATLQNTLTDLAKGTVQARGFCFPRKTFYLGQWIQYGGWYPNILTRMAHRDYARWTEPHVHEELVVTGPVICLTPPLHHYAFSSIQDQVLTNLRFSKLGAQDLIQLGQKPSLLRLLLKPIGKFIETYVLKRGFMDGLAGFIISVNAAHSMFLKYAYLNETRIKKG